MKGQFYDGTGVVSLCCFRIFTDAILAALVHTKSEVSFSEEDISHFYEYLLEMMPVYVPTDLSREAIESVVDEHPDIFTQKKLGDSFSVTGGTYLPNLDYFMPYSAEMKEYVLRLAEMWILRNKTL